MPIETYPEMNGKIVDILRWDKDNPMLLYTAQRIEELEAEVERLLHVTRTRGKCLEIAWQALEYIKDALPGTTEMAISALDSIEQCLAQLGPVPAPDALPCGHPRSAATSEAQEAQ